MGVHRSLKVRKLAALLLAANPALLMAAEKPSLRLVQNVLQSTAREDFADEDAAFQSAVAWYEQRLMQHGADHLSAQLACTDYGKGRVAFMQLEQALGRKSIGRISNNKKHGTCFVVGASQEQAATISVENEEYGLTSFGPIPAPLKLAPGLIDHSCSMPDDCEEARLRTTHGARIRLDNVVGLEVILVPGGYSRHNVSAGSIIGRFLHALMSNATDVHRSNMWSDPDPISGRTEHLYTTEGMIRSREWTRAADVLRDLSESASTSPGDICSWDILKFFNPRDDFLMVTGLDHLLPLGRGAGDTAGPESDELKMSCFMGLLSYLSLIPEVRRIAPLHRPHLANAVATAIAQSGDIADKPLTDAGLDGTGEVIQIVDSGLDESSCYFVEEDGDEVEHGYFFDELGFYVSSSSLLAVGVFTGGYFPVDLTRRKVVQYIQLIKSDEEEQEHGSGFRTTDGRAYRWYSASGFGIDLEEGHGTHTAGTAAGSTLSESATTADCENLACTGTCLTALEVSSLPANDELDFETLCPEYDCDGLGEPCLDDDVAQTLSDNIGMAPGAKLAIFDASVDGETVWASFAGNGLWEATDEADCFVHSNSWGGDTECNVDADCIAYDEYMFENQDHLLIFAAGNIGYVERSTCTINSAAIAKNVLAVGATSSGETRRATTTADGGYSSLGEESADIDTVASFSSYGFTQDSRIKPEVVAPGDQVLSAASDGTDSSSCALAAFSGTSMATPVVAGAAAMVRQYFKNESFYASDVNTRGLCEDLVNATNTFVCETFSPSAATVKGMLINSADLMGGSSSPDGYRGFGRVYLEGGLPMDGSGDLALYVADADWTSIDEYTSHEYAFDIAKGTDLDLRATLTWIDPPAEVDASTQLINDLDLTVEAPDGTSYGMWSDGADSANVVERVIVSADELEDSTGDWTISVSSLSLTDGEQTYSLVVTGPLSGGSGVMYTRENSAGALHEVGLAFHAGIALAVSAWIYLKW